MDDLTPEDEIKLTRLQAIIRGRIVRRNIKEQNNVHNTQNTSSTLERCTTVPFVKTSSSTIDTLIKFIDITPNDCFIDIGCGNGELCHTISDKCNIPSLGIDNNIDLISNAQRLCNPLCQFHCMDVNNPSLIIDAITKFQMQLVSQRQQPDDGTSELSIISKSGQPPRCIFYLFMLPHFNHNITHNIIAPLYATCEHYGYDVIIISHLFHIPDDSLTLISTQPFDGSQPILHYNDSRLMGIETSEDLQDITHNQTSSVSMFYLYTFPR